ncbi:MAG: ATP-binding protein [Planctomycetota bacterium]
MDGHEAGNRTASGSVLSDQCLKGILDKIPLAVCACDSEGLITYFNQRASILWGRSPELLNPTDRYCGSHKILTTEGDVVPHDKCGVALALRSGQQFEDVEARIERPDGEFRDVRANVFPLISENGRVNGAINLIVEDEDDEIYIDSKNEALERLTAGNEAQPTGAGQNPAATDQIKTEFIATLAHELRNSLVPLMAGFELLDMDDVAPDVLKKARIRMARQVRHIARLTEDLNDYSAIALGKVALARENVDLRESCEQAIELVQPLIEKSNQQLIVNLAPAPVVVEADATRMIQVVSNLLANATKFTPQDGLIEITCGRSAGRGFVSIKDDGIGIKTEDQNSIFDLFSQVDACLPNYQSGMGIGLAVSKALIQMLGGEISVSSDGHGQGSEFTINLPAKNAGAVPAAMPQEQSTKPEKLKVLVLDDNDAVATTLKHVLEAIGHDVATAADGRQGIEIAQKFLPDVVLCDIAMPEMSGFEFAGRIRKFKWAANIRLIACSGTSGIQCARDGQEAVFDSVLTKPVDLKTLARAVAP